MATYSLRFVDPDDATQFLGEPLDSNVLPVKGDVHSIGGKKYIVAANAKVPRTKAGQAEDGLEVHVRVKEQKPYPRISARRG